MIIKHNVSDIFLLPEGAQDAVCVTTNGKIRGDGRAVMGAGIAREADRRFGLAVELAQWLRRQGNHVFCFGARTDAGSGREMTVFSFPTKHDWRDPSSLDLIVQSAYELSAKCSELGIRRCYLTPPGCGLGKLDWESQVRPAIEPILDDRFSVVFR